MADPDSKPITFVIQGQERAGAAATRGATPPATLPPGFRSGRIKHSVIAGTQRGGADNVRVEAVPGTDVVVLQISGGPALYLHPEHARDLMRAQGDAVGTREGGPAAGSDGIEIPLRLRWGGAASDTATRDGARGSVGDVFVAGLDIVTDVVAPALADVIAPRIVDAVDGQVNEGVYRLNPNALSNLKNSGAVPAVASDFDGRPMLLFIHGTFSNTASSFGRLWTDHPQRVRAMFDHYDNQVFALDHATLGVSPIGNALTLARALPEKARLHLVTYSRGGLVGETLARLAAVPDLADVDLSKFAGNDQAALSELAKIVKEKQIRVDRIVRVAGPVRGTLLASKRLDAYLSVVKWTMELAGIPILPAILDLLVEVARQRADPMKVPGLAAQIPDSVLIRWLHAADRPISGDLRVIAGDIQGDSVTSWLKTLISDSYFWTDNDLVVQTSSMYGGVPRGPGATFILDRGGKVSHFNYFANERTAEAVVNALISDPPPQDFRVIGPLSWAGTSSTGLRAAPSDANARASERPAVFVLPGMFGSNLKADGNRIWLSSRITGGLDRLRFTTGATDGIEPDGPVDLAYDALMQFLSGTHEVLPFAFDWRRPMEEEARRLAKAVDLALSAREKNGQPVRLVAHSMGGLVARTMQLEVPDVWQRMMSHPGARLLMLGTPNAGSWVPLRMFCGDDVLANILAFATAPIEEQNARTLMAQFPGLLQLQAGLLDEKSPLGQAKTWTELSDRDLGPIRARMAAGSWWHWGDIQPTAPVDDKTTAPQHAAPDVSNVLKWVIPEQTHLTAASELRKRLNAQVEQDLQKFASKIVLVVGKADSTVAGYEIGKDGLAFLETSEGDGIVTLASARLPGVATWQLDCDHATLPAKSEAFGSYLALLNSGTDDAKHLRPVAEMRGSDVSTGPLHRRPLHMMRTAQSPPATAADVFKPASLSPPTSTASASTALRVTVVNSDLRFVREPLFIGHYRSLALTGTEAVVDRLIGGTMRRSLAAELYPSAHGSHQIFINTSTNRDNPLQPPRPHSVIVVGLGEEGKLGSDDLVYTMRQAVIAWSQRVSESDAGHPAELEIAATLIGSGGTGITAGRSARLIAEGVRGANQRIERLDGNGLPRVGHLKLVELYLDRAVEAWRALKVQSTATPHYYDITETVQSGAGSLRRLPDSDYRGADYDFISAVSDANNGSRITYTLDTRRARSEVRAQALQTPLLSELVSRASNDINAAAAIGRTLFQLLIPPELEPFLVGATGMVLELDDGTAGIPWELIDTDAGRGIDKSPWAIRSKLLRKLRTSEFRGQVVDADADDYALVIGEPQNDAPRLPAARGEALAVAERLQSADGLGVDKVKVIVRPDDAVDFTPAGKKATPGGADALTIINTLFERDWRIVHIAGHGAPPEKIGPVPKKPDDPPQKDGEPRGVLLSDGIFLGPREIGNMRVIPELVFVNCCHLAARNIGELLESEEPVPRPGRPFDRARFASSVADSLIKIGVRCVIAAGWAVDDTAANTFATTFYGAILRRIRFIDAVGEARKAALAHGGNTWGAYQCYGDPDWVFRRKKGDAQQPPKPPGDEFSGVASPQSLILALEALTVAAQSQGTTTPNQAARIRYLEARFESKWSGMGNVAEAFGDAWEATGDRSEAVNWYERALSANDARTSIKAAEQLGNLKVRVAWEKMDAAVARWEDLNDKLKHEGTAEARKELRAKLMEAERSKRDAAAAATVAVNASVGFLQTLVSLKPSVERHSLCGSAYKRLVMIKDADNHRQAMGQAVKAMKAEYQKAAQLAQAQQSTDIFYPILNVIAADLILNYGSQQVLDHDLVEMARLGLEAKCRTDPDFWSVSGQIELRAYNAIAEKNLSTNVSSIMESYADLYKRESSSLKWATVYDQMRFVRLALRESESPLPNAERAAIDDLFLLLKKLAEPGKKWDPSSTPSRPQGPLTPITPPDRENVPSAKRPQNRAGDRSAPLPSPRKRRPKNVP